MDAAGWTISIIAIGIALVIVVRMELGVRRTSVARAAGGRRGHAGGEVYEFMSPSWVRMAKREIVAALEPRDLDVEPFTLSEEFTDPPPHLADDAEVIGFAIHVGAGSVEVLEGPAPDADVRIISDYTDALEVARDPGADATDPVETGRRVAEGRLRIVGDPTSAPPVLHEVDIHRLLAEHTA